MPRDLFVYGSLMFSELVEAIIGRNPAWEPAFLPGYKRCLLAGSPYAIITPKSGETVEGLLLQELTEAELAALDRYEGEFYASMKVEVARADGSTARALAYGIAPGHESLVTDEPWVLDDYERDCLPNAIAEMRRSRL